MNLKLIIVSVVILACVGLATLGITTIRQYGETQYQAGYDKHKAEVSDAKEKAAIESRKLAEEQREKINQLQKNLQASRQRSEELSLQIRNAQFDNPVVDDEFFRLFNLGAKGGVHPDRLEARP